MCYKLYFLLRLSALCLLVVSTLFGRAQTGFADVTISAGATSNGTWSGGTTGPYTFTPNASVSAANINVADITARLCNANPCGTYTTNNVTIVTTSTSGTGNGDITISAPITGGLYHTTAYTFTINAGRHITINTGAAINLTPATAGNGQDGRQAHSVTLTAGNGGSVTVLSAITLTGGAGGFGSGGNGANGGNLTITAGNAGSVKLSADITTSGGNAPKSGTGGSAGAISITGPGGVTIASNITASGGAGTTGANGNGGNITINDGSSVVTTGGGANDGQTAGIIAAVAGTGGAGGSGGSFTKTGAGTLVLGQLNTYTGATSVNAGIVRVSVNPVIASSNGPLGNNASGLNLNGGSIQSNTATFSRPITVTATNSGLDAYGTARTISSTITGTGSYNLNAGGATAPGAEGQHLALTGVISNAAGSLSLTKTGTSVLTLSGANTFTGGVTLNAGQLNINTSTAPGSGTFTINGGTIDNTSAGAITLANNNTQSWNGDFTFAGTQPLNMGTGTVTMGNSLQVTVSAGTLTAGGIINHSGLNLTKSGNGTLSFGSQAITLHDLIVSAGTLNANSATLNLSGDFSNSGTFTSNNGTVSLTGSTAQIIGGSGPIAVHNLVTNNSAGFTLNNDLTISGTHTFSNGIITTATAPPNYVIYEAGASYTGDDDTKHINGWVRKEGTTDFIFPVGNGTVERPVAISNLSASSVFNVNYGGATTNTGNVMSPLVTVDPNEYWNINQVSGGTAQVTLNWDNSKVAFPDYPLADIRVASYTSGNWNSVGGSATGDVSTTGSITSPVISSFGAFTPGSVSAALPVTLLQFSARKMNDNVLISWKVADEFNLDRYEIQRSDDGQDFKYLAGITAANTASVKQYVYVDKTPVIRTAYYRLRGIDRDGSTTLSKVVAVSDRVLPADHFTITCSANGNIIFTAGPNHSGIYTYTISTTTGQTLAQGRLTITNGGSYNISLPGAAAKGIYVLQVAHGTFRITQKILIE